MSDLGLTRPLPGKLEDGEALRNFAEAMSVAASSARQLAFLRSDPQWIAVQNALEGAREHAMALAKRRRTSPLILPDYMRRMQ